MTKRAKPKLVASSAPDDSPERFIKLAGHLRVNGRPIVPMPWSVTPEAQALRQEKAAARQSESAS